MKFTVEETNLMCIYGTESRKGLIKELEAMQKYLQEDEVDLQNLSDAVILKLKGMSDEEFEEAKKELVADFG
ncbi:MAG: transposon-transfer assisting family protein [Eubacteriales bacterium]